MTRETEMTKTQYTAITGRLGNVTTPAAVEAAIRRCIHDAYDSGGLQGEWHAVTLWADGHIEQRMGVGGMTYGEDEYFDRPGCEMTIYTMDAVTDPDPCGDYPVKDYPNGPDMDEIESEVYTNWLETLALE